MLSAAPIYLENSETLDGVATDFYVSNHNGDPNANLFFPDPYFFQWQSHSNNKIISVPD